MSVFTYNFQSRFVTPILSGTKPHTIRAARKDGRLPKPGDPLRFYTGMRSRACAHVADAQCLAVASIRIQTTLDGLLEVGVTHSLDETALRGWVAISDSDALALCLRDGFTSASEFIDFFLPFAPSRWDGHIIYWLPESVTLPAIKSVQCG